MGLTSSIGGFFKKIGATIAEIFSEVQKIVGVFINIKDYTIGAFQRGFDLVHEVEDEWDKIMHLDVQPHWRNRVISVPKVINNIKELAALPQRVIDAVKDLISNFRSRAQSLEIAETVEEMLPVLGQILGIATLIAEILLAIQNTLDDLKTIVDAIKTVREDLENLDILFLQQHNRRKSLPLREGGSIKIRVGGLHTE